jgi:hypothetical protein
MGGCSISMKCIKCGTEMVQYCNNRIVQECPRCRVLLLNKEIKGNKNNDDIF